MRVSFDIDGVLADGRYVEREDRTPSFYAGMEVTHPLAIPTLNEIASRHTTYIISSRKYRDATRSTQWWLAAKGVDVGQLGGVLCGIPTLRKPALCDFLGITYHIDDDPTIMDGLRADDMDGKYKVNPILLWNPSRFDGLYKTWFIDGWPALQKYLSTIGLL